MTAIFASQNFVHLAQVSEGHIGRPTEMANEMLARERDHLRAKIEYDSKAQLEWQNAQPIYSGFRLNGELVGMIGVNTGFTGSGISDGGAYQRAIEVAKQTGLTGEAFAKYATDQVSQALKARYGDRIEVEVYDTENRPTSGEMHTEMFGPPASTPDTPKFNDSELAWMKVFAQLYSQNFGEDPFAGLDVPYDQ
ncbi:hypothetical protein [Thalassospira sp.]|uniref:hypothetical protein n=1 Tax=Thalassospira sp. TaxID=1912094 RepID=UPI002734848B|nr:hypothetical protein [Thalassospira sp.]MDP2697066.1 hypothetical protein [Thalassospira sp.]